MKFVAARDKITLPGEEKPRGGLDAAQAKVMADAIAILKQQGAVVVDPADIPSYVDKDPKSNFLLWDYCSGGDQAGSTRCGCSGCKSIRDHLGRQESAECDCAADAGMA